MTSEGTSGRLPVAPSTANLREALEVIQAGASSICLMVDDDDVLIGTLSDGDARRAFLAGTSLDASARPWMNPNPITVESGTGRSTVLDLMQALALTQIPEVDARGRVMKLHMLREIIGASARSNRTVILAGGSGTRLKSVTGDLPKPMVPIAGRPLLERLVLHLIGSGFTRISIAVGYGADVIKSHFGDGSKFGCTVDYLEEEEPLGTAGPLRGLLDGEPLVEPVLVMNGDLVTSFSVDGIVAAHATSGADLTVAVADYAHEIPFGVLERSPGDDLVVAFSEKPTWTATINAGIYVFEPRLIESIPAGQASGMGEIIEECLARGSIVKAWPIRGEWHDVGQPSDYRRAVGHV